MEILKALFASPHGWTLLLVAIAVVAILFLIVLHLMWKQTQRGGKAKFFGLEFFPPKPLQDLPQAVAPTPGPRLPKEKTVYVKLLHLRVKKGSDKPVYRHVFAEGPALDVWDEALYLFFESFPGQQPSFRWKVRSSGTAYPNLLHPWMDKIIIPDFGEPSYGPLVAPICHVESSVYIPITQLFNGQQPGHRDVQLLAESDLERARLVLDSSSVPTMKLSNVQAFRGNESGQHQPIGSTQPRPGIFTCFAENLKLGDTLGFTYDAEPR